MPRSLLSRPMRLFIVMTCVLASALSACGSGGGTPPPTPGATLGQGCGDGTSCQAGLACAPTNVCVHVRCTKSVDPEDTCSQKLGLAPERVQCNSDGTCSPKQVINEGCEDDSACVFGFVCEQETCVETCLSDASCPGQNRACLERSSDPDVRVCQDQYCGDMPDPGEFCDQKLQFPRGGAMCTPEGCREQNLARGEACEYTPSCTGSDRCDQGVCSALCSSYADCDAGSDCALLDTSFYSVCRAIEDCTQATRSDDFCSYTLNTRAVCDTATRACVSIVDPLPQVILRDRSLNPDDPTCDVATYEGQDDAWPGVDLYGATLTNRDTGQVVAIGRVVEWSDMPNIIEEGPYSSVPESLNGAGFEGPVACPMVYDDQSVLSLGCAGAVVLSFFDDDGNIRAPGLREDISIYEFDDQCTSGGKAQDPYDVVTCYRISDSACDQPPCSSCNRVLGQRFGSAVFQVF